MHVIDSILRRQEFIEQPPVLVDIGASGAIHHKWRRIAPYAVCIAFDADDREMGFAIHESKGYRKLYVFNRILAAQPAPSAPFYLTRSPYCSSLLRPDRNSLDTWAFGGLFDVDRVADLEVVTLPSVLAELGIAKVDWFKTDSQGTDLRLFRSLGDDIVRRVLLAEFEPGIIDAYEQEDKLFSLMAFMDGQPFWLSGLEIKGSQRIRRQTFEAVFSPVRRRLLGQLMKTAPGWGEVTYLNTFSDSANYLDKRDYLLGWIIAVIENHLGFALDIALQGAERFNDPVFEDMRRHCLHRIRWEYRHIPLYLMRRFAAYLAGLVGSAG